MRTTASYELFPDAPSERAIARARYLVREGRAADAEQAYRDVLAEHPDLKSGWAECFELLRDQGRREDALGLAEGARAKCGDQAFALALKGAALIELERYREALATLEQAVAADPDLAPVWPELGYAAFRLGDKNRALLALDRAFALEPHTETPRLRGRIFRDPGRYQAAEVAHEGAAPAPQPCAPGWRRRAPSRRRGGGPRCPPGWPSTGGVSFSCSSTRPSRPVRAPTWSASSPTPRGGAPAGSTARAPCPRPSTRRGDWRAAGRRRPDPADPRRGLRDCRSSSRHAVGEIPPREPVRARRPPHHTRRGHSAYPHVPLSR